MCHNAIHEAIQRTNLYGKLDGVVTGDCEILLRLCSSTSEATDCVLHHVKEAVAFIVKVERERERILLKTYYSTCTTCAYF